MKPKLPKIVLLLFAFVLFVSACNAEYVVKPKAYKIVLQSGETLLVNYDDCSAKAKDQMIYVLCQDYKDGNWRVKLRAIATQFIVIE